MRAIDAPLDLSGDGVRAGAVAEEALRQFADYPDTATAALVHHRAALFRAIETPAAGLPLIKESLRLFEQSPPSADHAEAWLELWHCVLVPRQGQLAASATAVNQALEIAEAAGATAQIPHLLLWLSNLAFLRGRVEEGSRQYSSGGRASAETSGNGVALVWLAMGESNALMKIGKFPERLRRGAAGPRSCPPDRPAGQLSGCHPGLQCL